MGLTRFLVILHVVRRPDAGNFIKKEALTQVLSCKFYETFKNTFFYRAPLVVASNSTLL